MTNTSSNGMKFDDTKPDYSLMPFGALDEVVKVLTYGANKYDRFNWEKVERHRYEAAAMRHISAYMQGEIHDDETGINHTAHAICNLLFLLEFDNKSEKKDKKAMYNGDELIYNTTYQSIDSATPEEWNQAYRNVNVTVNGMNYETK